MVRKATAVVMLSAVLSLTGVLGGGVVANASPGQSLTIPPRCC